MTNHRLRITRALTKHLAAIAEDCGATAVLVYTDALQGEPLELPAELDSKVIYLSKTEGEQSEQERRGSQCIRVPNVKLTRLGQVKIAIFLSLARAVIHRGDVIVCLTGAPASGSLDTLFVTEVGAEFESFSIPEDDSYLPPGVSAEVVERVIDIAVALGSEGREGKPVGALFVIGDSQRVTSLSRQLIINPFRGYTEEERNILDPALEETVKELCTIDGAFIIRGDGVIETCGAYLKTSLPDDEELTLPQGLGARHHAAAGITAVTNSLAITVSESTGTVTVFGGGKILTEIEKLRRNSGI